MCDCKFDLRTEAVRKGRAHYVCPICGVDCTLTLVLLYELDEKQKKAKKKSSQS